MAGAYSGSVATHTSPQSSLSPDCFLRHKRRNLLIFRKGKQSCLNIFPPLCPEYFAFMSPLSLRRNISSSHLPGPKNAGGGDFSCCLPRGGFAGGSTGGDLGGAVQQGTGAGCLPPSRGDQESAEKKQIGFHTMQSTCTSN